MGFRSSAAALLAAALVITSSAPAAVRFERPVLVPNATLGHEAHEQGASLALPPLDSLMVVQHGVDRGAGFSAPTDYPPERHVIYAPSEDSYFAFYEWNSLNDYMVTGRYWQEVGGIGYWSFEGTVSERFTHADAGRPSAHELEGGVMVAYHASSDVIVYNLWINRFDSRTETWGTSVQITDHAVGNTFPFLDRASDGTWMIVSQEGWEPADIVVNVSDDEGATWIQYTVATGVENMWCLPSGAADPENGDLYVAYNDDIDHDQDLEVMLHRSTDGGATWSAAQLIAKGAPFSQKVEPSLVVDRDHRVHLVYQANLSEDAAGGLAGLTAIGMAGPPYHTYGAFVGGTWIEEATIPIMDRDELVALPDSCGLNPNLLNLATDTLTGMPQLGIHRGESSDRLYVGYNSSYMSTYDQYAGGWEICGPAFQSWMQSNDLGGTEGWSEREMISAISQADADAGKNTIYLHTTHEVPAAGPGFLWSEMFESQQPSDVMFVRQPLATTPLALEFGSPDPDIAPGEALSVDYSIRNEGDETIAFELWCDLLPEGGLPYAGNPLYGPNTLSLEPGEERAGQVLSRLPSDVLPGAHQLCLRAGEFPVEPSNDACFTFTITSPLALSLEARNPVVPRGAALELDYQVENGSDAAAHFELWADGFDCAGVPDPDNPLLGPVPVVLSGGARISGGDSYAIPVDAELGGPYRICLRAGGHPHPTFGEDCAEYYVIPAAAPDHALLLDP